MLVIEGKHMKGTKMMKSKKRVTVLIATNASGSYKMPPVVIGKYANPRCFHNMKKNQRKPLKYMHQKNAWIDAPTLQDWFDNVFLWSKRQFFGRENVLLFWDNFPAHDKLINKHADIKIVTLPPNLTSVFQPMDQGVIAAFKMRYKHALLKKVCSLLEDIPALLNLRKEANKFASGLCGIAYGLPPTLLDCLTIAKDVWDEVSNTSIMSCWIKADCLPSAQLANLKFAFARSKQATSTLPACPVATVVHAAHLPSLQPQHPTAEELEPSQQDDSEQASQPLQHSLRSLHELDSDEDEHENEDNITSFLVQQPPMTLSAIDLLELDEFARTFKRLLLSATADPTASELAQCFTHSVIIQSDLDDDTIRRTVEDAILIEDSPAVLSDLIHEAFARQQHQLVSEAEVTISDDDDEEPKCAISSSSAIEACRLLQEYCLANGHEQSVSHLLQLSSSIQHSVATKATQSVITDFFPSF
jgi:hypothetical protein